MASVELQRPDLLGLQIVECPLAVEEIFAAVDADIAHQKDITGVGIVLRMIGIDGDSPVTDLDIVIRDGGSVLETRVAIRGDLHRLVTEVPELGTGHPAHRADQG